MPIGPLPPGMDEQTPAPGLEEVPIQQPEVGPPMSEIDLIIWWNEKIKLPTIRRGPPNPPRDKQ